MAPRQAHKSRKWCCRSSIRSNSSDDLAVRHPILSKHRLQHAPSSITTRSLAPTDTEMSFLAPRRDSDDSILPDPRSLAGRESPSTSTGPGRLTPTGVVRTLRQRLSKGSTHFKYQREQRRLQKKGSKSARSLKQQDSSVSMDDLIGLQLAQRTPSRGGYDADAQPLTDAGLLARLNETGVASRGMRYESTTAPATPTRPNRYVARLPRSVVPQASRGSPLIKMQRLSSEESSEESAPRTSTSTSGKDSTPRTLDDTGDFTMQTVSSLGADPNLLGVDSKHEKKVVPKSTIQSSSEEHSDLRRPPAINRLSLGAFSQSSLHLKSALMQQNTSLTNVPQLMATNSTWPRVSKIDEESVNPENFLRPSNTYAAAPHLHEMRISQHLRSLSSFSEIGAAKDSQGITSNTIRGPQRIITTVHPAELLTGNVKLTKSDTGSGVDSLDIPSTWGKVVSPADLSRTNSSPSDESEGFPLIAEDLPETAARKALADLRESHRMMERKDSVLYDGPSDEQLALAQGSLSKTRTRGSSISDNFDETAAVWEKAMNEYQLEKLSSSRQRGSSSAATNGSGLRTPSGSISGTFQHGASHETGQGRAVSRIELPRVSTEHTFSQLPMPRRRSSSLRPEHLSDHDHRPSINVTIRERSTSQSVAGGINHEPLEVPHITLTRPGRESEVPIPTTPVHTPKKRLVAWTRFPSEDREDRNASAGITDNVITRDFAPPSPTKSVSEHAASSMKKKAKKVKGFVTKPRFLSELPSIFKHHGSSGRITGHRSSIAPGGHLEYPELELLPGADVHEVSAMDSWRIALESAESSVPAYHRRRHQHDDDGNRTVTSLGGSSAYGSEPGSPAHSMTSNRTNVPNAEAWARIYGQDLDPLDAPTEKQSIEMQHKDMQRISPFDGMSSESLLPTAWKAPKTSKSMLSLRTPSKSPGSKSLPPTLRVKVESPEVQRREGRFGMTQRPMLGKIASTEGLRRSTQDLNRMLEENAQNEAERALRAAESWV